MRSSSYIGGETRRRENNPAIRARTNRTTNTKNSNCAIHADAAAIPLNPNTAATMAMTKNTSAQYNIVESFPADAAIPGRRARYYASLSGVVVAHFHLVDDLFNTVDFFGKVAGQVALFF